jgi:site-specific recombinase XerD
MFNQQKTQWTRVNPSTADTNLLLWIEAFLVSKRAENLAKGSIYFYQKKLKLFAEFCDSQIIKEITQVTPDTIRQFLLWLEQTKHNAGGVHACYRALKAFLLWFEDEFEPDNWKNPIKKVAAPKVPIEPLEGVSTDNFQKLLDVCNRKTYYGERDRAILLTLLDTGIRASELINLDLDDFDYISGSLLVKQGKGRKPRMVFTGKKTRRQIRSFLKKRGAFAGALFITQAGDRLTYFGLRDIVRRLSKKARISEQKLHGFRRAFALNLWKSGVDLETIARLLGHGSLQVLWVYLKTTNQDLNQHYISPVDNG